VRGREGGEERRDGWRWRWSGCYAVCEVGESDGGVFGHVGAFPYGLVREEGGEICMVLSSLGLYFGHLYVREKSWVE